MPMLEGFFQSWRATLSPQQALEFANLQLAAASITQDPAIVLALCEQAETSLDRMKRPKMSNTSDNPENKSFREEVATAYSKHAKFMAQWKYNDKELASLAKSEKWRYLSSKEEALAPGILIVREPMPLPEDIFKVDNARPLTDPLELPESNKQLIDTPQLAYCLAVLYTASSPEIELLPNTDKWLQVIKKDKAEQKRLKGLVNSLVREFTRDELKNAEAVAEVTYVASVLEPGDFRFLLKFFVTSLKDSAFLEVHSLEGIARLMSSAPFTIEADDLVKTLYYINTSLQTTHAQSEGYVYKLTTTVSHVLDAMADSHVVGLEREGLHKPLYDYLEGLKSSEDPYLVFEAAYAFQALLCVPDDESKWQATQRKAGRIINGAFQLVGAVKALDVNSFIDVLCNLQMGLKEIYHAAEMVRDVYGEVKSLCDSGEELRAALQDVSFNRKRAWYTALRGTDTVLRNGMLAEFKPLVCGAPCRRALAFQWGVCLRLGSLAIDKRWDKDSRHGAVAFLGQLYRDDKNWGHHVPVKQLVLDILMHLSKSSESVAQAEAKALLEKLKDDGSWQKRAMFLACLESGPSQHPLIAAMSPPASSALLDRVQGIVDVEADLKRLRLACEKRRVPAVYIQPKAKDSIQASDESLFDLEKMAHDFLLNEERKVLLLLGESGVGKSTFNMKLEQHLWVEYEKHKVHIPLFISLPTIVRPEQDLIAKQLRRLQFEESQIRVLKNRKFVLICDGYDESQQMHNLYISNQLNQEGGWQAKLVISCRTEYVGLDYKYRFQPGDRNHPLIPGQFQEAVIMPFTGHQIEEYIQEFVAQEKPQWSAADYSSVLEKIPSLRELVKNPFLLTLSLDVLPRLVDPGNNIKVTKVRRVTLYDEFVVLWLERGKKRLENKDMDRQERADFDRLIDEGFTQNGISFLTDMAKAIYKNQAGNPIVTYTRKRDQGTWKEAFLSRENESQLLLEASPLTRSGIQYRFIHKSLLEYFFARSVFEPQDGRQKSSQAVAPTRRESLGSTFSFDDQLVPEEEEEPIATWLSAADHPLSWRSLVGEPSVLDFLSDRAQQEPSFKEQLHAIVEESKVNKEMRKAAANAITILIRAGVRFNGADLKGIQIPNADLTGGEFDSAQLQGADLRKANLRNIWLRQADLSNAQMAGVQFGEWPYLDQVFACTYSADGKMFAVALTNDTIILYNTATGKKTRTLSGHTNLIQAVAFSPSSQQIASGGSDKTVRLWDAETGTVKVILSDHTDQVMSVAFSPCGQQIASGGSDKTVRLWDAETGTLKVTLSDHTDEVMSVAFSPCGQQIASGSYDETVRLWDSGTGTLRATLSGHNDGVMSVMFSPNGRLIASGSRDNMLRLLDAKTGLHRRVLSGHRDGIVSVAFSPSSKQIVSGSFDKTVRLWDAETGALRAIFDHTGEVMSVAFSPCGRQIASGSIDNVRFWDAQAGANDAFLGGHTDYFESVVFSATRPLIASGSPDNTVRIWDPQTGDSFSILRGHTDRITSVVFSPSGQQIASGSFDTTVRIWDAHTGEPCATIADHTDRITTVAFSPNGQKIVSCSLDKTVRLWDAKTGTSRAIISSHTDHITSVVFSPSGQLIASGSWDKTVRLWDAETGDIVTLIGHKGTVYSVLFSPSGHRIASASQDKTVRLWDSQTGETVVILHGHSKDVFSVAFSTDGHQIVSGGYDQTMQLWDTKSGRCLVVITVCEKPIYKISWVSNLDGSQFLSTSSGDSVYLWKVMEGNDFSLRLIWCSTPNRLNVLCTNIQNVQNLSETNIQLLKQHGSLGKPALSVMKAP